MRRMLNKGFAAVVLGAALWSAAGSAQADQLSVEMDKARPLRLAEPASAVVIGNPLIADAIVHDRRTLIVTGKSFGETNLIILNEEGQTVLALDLSVVEGSSPQTALVSLHRGMDRYSYACAGGGDCQSRPLIGDSDDAFQAVSAQRASQLAAAHAEAEQ